MNPISSDTVALITGSSRGIGRALALSLADDGAAIVINYRRNAELAQETVAEVERRGGRAIAVQADMEHAEEIERLFAAAADAYGRLDIFVGNAAATAFKPIMELGVHNLDRSYAVNVRSFVLGAQAAVRLMDRGGRIVAVTSYGSLHAYPAYGNLGSAKAAVEAWVRYMALELAPRGINVNAVNGGIIDTASSAYYYNVEGVPSLQETVLDKIPKRRMGTPGEVAAAARFLVEPASEYITGQVLIVDGGISVTTPPFYADASGPLSLEQLAEPLDG